MPPGGQLVLVGRIVRAHGIRGELVVQLHTESPDAVYAPGARVFCGTATGEAGPNPDILTVESARPFKDGLLVAFEEIVDRTQAERWRERFLLVPEDELEAPADDEVFVHDLVGLTVFRSTGEEIGKVVGTYDVADRLLLEIRRTTDTVLVPWEVSFVQGVDVEQGRLVMQLPDGLLD